MLPRREQGYVCESERFIVLIMQYIYIKKKGCFILMKQHSE
jgi:hypothetical protein